MGMLKHFFKFTRDSVSIKTSLAMTNARILKVSMTSITGKATELKGTRRPVFNSDNLAPGIYFFKTGMEIFKGKLF
jgi:hypothetical protein